MQAIHRLLLLLLFLPLWADTDELSPIHPGGVGEPRAFGDSIVQWNVTTITGSSVILGVTFAQDHFWFTAGGLVDHNEANNYLYKVSRTGLLVATFIQPTSSPWGWRDLTTDGVYLYGSDSTVIDQISMVTGQKTGFTIPVPGGLTVGRGLAYDSLTHHFFVGNFGTNIYEIDDTGTVVNTIVNTHATYGLAFERSIPGGPFVYTWHQDDDADLNRFTLAGVDSGTLFGAAPGIVAGGAETTHLYMPGQLHLLCVEQGGPDDYLNVYDMDRLVAIIPTLSAKTTVLFIALLLSSALFFNWRRRQGKLA